MVPLKKNKRAARKNKKQNYIDRPTILFLFFLKQKAKTKIGRSNDEVCYDDADLVVLVAALFRSLLPAAALPTTACTETVDPAGEYPTTPATAGGDSPSGGDRGAQRTIVPLPPDHPADPVESSGSSRRRRTTTTD